MRVFSVDDSRNSAECEGQSGMNITLTPAQKQQYREEGYFILRGIVPPAQIEALRAGVHEVMDDSLTGKRPPLRWINKEKRIPDRFGGMLRPEFIHSAFVESFADGPYISVAEQILDCPVRYGLFGMLANGDGQPYVQDWHRDLAPIEGDQQLPILERGYRVYTQTNAPLFEDHFLTIVPGSHLRVTTPEELAAYRHAPAGDLPGQITVETQPGDVAFYYSNLWHRGYNPGGELRWTMHHAFLRYDAPVYSHEGGQREWITSPGYLEGLPAVVATLMQRYVDAYPEGELPDLRVM